MTPTTPAGIHRLFPAPAGYGEDNGHLLAHLLPMLPADRISQAANTSRALSLHTAGIRPECCGLPCAEYLPALETGNLAALLWYWSRDASRLGTETFPNPNGPALSAVNLLAGRGHLAALQLALAFAPDCLQSTRDGLACVLAATHGHLEVLRWLRGHGAKWTKYAITMAAYAGHAEVVHWAHADGCPWDSDTCDYMIRAGDFDLVLWACEHGCPWSKDICTQAAKHGRLDVLQRARLDDCRWSARTIDAATAAGHHGVADWARENDCPA